MFKWLIAIFLVVLLLARTPLARMLRLGDLPGDLRLRSGRYKLHLPLTSTLLIAASLYLFSRLI
jgi:Protein of unknown function (DUF2905)